MRTRERLLGLKGWITKELCDGREMKAPGKNMNIAEIVRQKPTCYLAWTPARIDQTGQQVVDDLISVTPGIIVMPNQAYVKYIEDNLKAPVALIGVGADRNQTINRGI